MKKNDSSPLCQEGFYEAAVYLRLSKEDGDAGPGSGKGESNSITNQKRLIYDFLKGKEDIRVFQEYVDDGYTKDCTLDRCVVRTKETRPQ